MNNKLFEYKNQLYPEYLKHGNAMQFIEPIAKQFCIGKGIDVGASQWPFPGAIPVELKDGGDAYELPEWYGVDGKGWDYIFSSHCLEHLNNPVAAIEHWETRLRSGGVLFLYLPHPDQKYWRPQNCRKHLHLFWPDDTAQMLRDLGFVDVIHSERDLNWSFAVVGFKA